MRLREDIVPYTAGDGMELNLIRVRGEAEPTSGPVILVHGAGVRANIFLRTDPAYAGGRLGRARL